MTENELRDLRELFRDVPLITRAESRKIVHKLLDEIDKLRDIIGKVSEEGSAALKILKELQMENQK